MLSGTGLGTLILDIATFKHLYRPAGSGADFLILKVRQRKIKLAPPVRRPAVYFFGFRGGIVCRKKLIGTHKQICICIKT